jgi:hypothetical protein
MHVSINKMQMQDTDKKNATSEETTVALRV